MAQEWGKAEAAAKATIARLENGWSNPSSGEEASLEQAFELRFL